MINPQSRIEITAFSWVPDFAQGFVRDLRPRWACEETGLEYSERLLDALQPRPASYYREQPWGQVPVLKDDGVTLFESGAILLHLAGKDERLLPVDPQRRATTLSWLFAAFNSIEPLIFEHTNVTLFARDEQWAKLRKPGLEAFLGQRLDRLSDALGAQQWLTGSFSVADIAMSTVLREIADSELLSSRPSLADYVTRSTQRPAFQRALDAQLAAFKAHQPPGAPS
jgi:glutathione S-transferase